MLDTWHLWESKRNNSSLFWWIQKSFILVLLKIWNINAITTWINYNWKNYRNVEEMSKGITAIKNQLRCFMFSTNCPVVATFAIWIFSKFFNLHIEFLNHHITFIITVLCYHTKLEFNIFPLDFLQFNDDLQSSRNWWGYPYFSPPLSPTHEHTWILTCVFNHSA